MAASTSTIKEVLQELEAPEGHAESALLERLASVIGESSEGPAEVLRTPGSLDILSGCLCTVDVSVSNAAVSVFALLAQNWDPGAEETLHQHEGAGPALLKGLASGVPEGHAHCATLLNEAIKFNQDALDSIVASSADLKSLIAFYARLEEPDVSNPIDSLFVHMAEGEGAVLRGRAISSAGVSEPLVQRLGSEDAKVVASATHMSMRLLRDERCRLNLVAAGCVPKLVSLLEHPDALIQSNAVGALTEAIKIPSASTALQEAKIIKKLISMLERPVLVGPPAEGEAPGVEPAPVLLETNWGSLMFNPVDRATAAAGVLAQLAKSPEGKRQIYKENGVKPLLGLVRQPNGQARCRCYALAALQTLLDIREQWLRDLPLETIVPGVVEAMRSEDPHEFVAACEVADILLHPNRRLDTMLEKEGLSKALQTQLQHTHPAVRSKAAHLLTAIRGVSQGGPQEVQDNGLPSGPGQADGGGGGCARCGALEAEGGGHLKACGACLKVVYCNATCQKGDWKAHKAACKATQAAAAAG